MNYKTLNFVGLILVFLNKESLACPEQASLLQRSVELPQVADLLQPPPITTFKILDSDVLLVAPPAKVILASKAFTKVYNPSAKRDKQQHRGKRQHRGTLLHRGKRQHRGKLREIWVKTTVTCTSCKASRVRDSNPYFGSNVKHLYSKLLTKARDKGWDNCLHRDKGCTKQGSHDCTRCPMSMLNLSTDKILGKSSKVAKRQAFIKREYSSWKCELELALGSLTALLGTKSQPYRSTGQKLVRTSATLGEVNKTFIRKIRSPSYAKTEIRLVNISHPNFLILLSQCIPKISAQDEFVLNKVDITKGMQRLGSTIFVPGEFTLYYSLKTPVKLIRDLEAISLDSSPSPSSSGVTVFATAVHLQTGDSPTMKTHHHHSELTKEEIVKLIRQDLSPIAREILAQRLTTLRLQLTQLPASSGPCTSEQSNTRDRIKCAIRKIEIELEGRHDK